MKSPLARTAAREASRTSARMIAGHRRCRVTPFPELGSGGRYDPLLPGDSGGQRDLGAAIDAPRADSGRCLGDNGNRRKAGPAAAALARTLAARARRAWRLVRLHL